VLSEYFEQDDDSGQVIPEHDSKFTVIFIIQIHRKHPQSLKDLEFVNIFLAMAYGLNVSSWEHEHLDGKPTKAEQASVWSVVEPLRGS
jgi:hypothetical protein